jgi:hypothetical protein
VLRETAAQLLGTQIIGSQEVQEVLKINRRRLSALVAAGKITPFKEIKGVQLYWMPEVEKLKAEMLTDTRTNLYKNQ